ncbi:hypothetical protein EYR36_000321 [Pleurotus pulmonarius]|nr:hypothetical protein EYR36_000321 [Pleurotus pulmonarius]
MSTILYPGPGGLRYSGAAVAASPISRLPAEVLREIFKLSIHNETRSYTPSPQCAVLSHVSRLWRTVALLNPSLWAFIVTDRGRWIEAHIKRSGTRPLSVQMNIDDLTEATLKNIDLVFTQAPRLQEIDIYHAIQRETSGGLEQREWDTLCARFFASLRRCFVLPMPMLQTFNLLANEVDGRSITLGETPNIQSMAIVGAGLSSSPSLGRLVSLDIRFYLPSDEFVAALATMKNLSDLRIMDPIICEHSVFPASPRVITLSRLKTFKFVGCALGYAILKYFTIDSPILECLEVGVIEADSSNCIETDDPSEHLPDFLKMIQFFPSSCFESQSLTIHITTAGLLTLSLACTPQGAGIRKMVFQAYDVDIASLYKIIPVNQVRCLTLKEEDSCKDNNDEDEYHISVFDIVKGLDSLEEIRLFNPEHLHTLSVLLDKHPEILPSFTYLVVRFRQCEEHFARLQQIMMKRPLRRLTLLDSEISWTKVTLMHHQHREMEIRIWPPMNSSLYAHEVLRDGRTCVYYDSPTITFPVKFILGDVYDEPVFRLLDEPDD